MKNSAWTFLLLLSTSPLAAQQVANNGFEGWETTYSPESPTAWKTNRQYASSTLYPTPATADKTADAYVGSWAVKLTTKFFNGTGSYILFPGFLANGTTGTYPLLTHGVAYGGRPTQMGFRYKFSPVGGDTAVAQVRLLKLRADGSLSHVVGEGSYDITQPALSYTPAVMTLTLYTADVPDALQIAFSTSKSLYYQHLLTSGPGSGVHAGTALWLDNIELGGRALSARAPQRNSLLVFPVPATTAFTVKLAPEAAGASGKLLLYNLTGQLVREVHFANTSQCVVDRQQLAAGVYLCKVVTGNQAATVGRIVLE